MANPFIYIHVEALRMVVKKFLSGGVWRDTLFIRQEPRVEETYLQLRCIALDVACVKLEGPARTVDGKLAPL